MISRLDLFVAISALLLIALVVTAGVYWKKSRRAADSTWESLLERLNDVNRGNVARVALDLIDEDGVNSDAGPELDSTEIWKLLGGLEGMERLEANCDVLIDLAFYVQREYPEALVIAEDLRLKAREIQWHVSRLKGAAERGNLETSFADYAQRAAATYYLMTRHLLALYEAGNLPGYSQLQAAL